MFAVFPLSKIYFRHRNELAKDILQEGIIMDTTKAVEKLWTTDYIFSVLLLFLCNLGPCLVVAVISVFAKNLTGSDTYAGMMASVFALSGFAGRFLCAALLEKINCKKLMIFSAAVLCGASFGYLFTSNFPVAVALRLLQGLGYSLTATTMSTYIVKIVPVSRRLDGIGYSTMAGQLASVIGPSVAFAVVGVNYDRFTLLFGVVFAITALTTLGLFFVRNISIRAEKSQHENKDASRINWIALLPMLTALFLIDFVFGPLSSLLSLYAIEINIGNVGSYFLLSAAGMMLSRFTASKIVQKLGMNQSVIAFAGLLVIGLLGISRVNALWQLFLLALVMGFAQGSLLPLVNTILLNRMPESKSGVANAVFYGIGDFSFIISPTLMGTVAGLTSYRTMFFLSAGIALAGLVIFTVSMILSRKKAVAVLVQE